MYSCKRSNSAWLYFSPFIFLPFPERARVCGVPFPSPAAVQHHLQNMKSPLALGSLPSAHFMSDCLCQIASKRLAFLVSGLFHCFISGPASSSKHLPLCTQVLFSRLSCQQQQPGILFKVLHRKKRSPKGSVHLMVTLQHHVFKLQSSM